MKKILLLFSLLFVTLCLSSCSSTVARADYEEVDGGCKITKIYPTKSKSVTIPSTYGGLPVVELGDYILCDNEKVTSVTVPEGVVKIGQDFLNSCVNLKKLNLPSTLEEVGKYFLYDTPDLKKINVTEGGNLASVDGVLYTSDMKTLVRFPSGKNLKVFDVPAGVLEISNDAFAESVYLERVAVSPDVRKLGNNAFYNCKKLKSVNMSPMTESIGIYAFADCYLLKEIEIPDEVISIGESAFLWCEALESITVGKKLANIGKKAFVGCSKLSSIDVSEENATFATLDGHLVSKDKKTFYQCAYARYNTVLNIPLGIETIAEYSCYENKVITTINIPDSVVRVEDEAFSACDSVTTVTVGSGVEYVGFYAFQCRNLNMITFSSPDGWEYSKYRNFTKDVYSVTLDSPYDNVKYVKNSGYALRKAS